MIKEKSFKLKEIKNKLQEYILNEEGYLVISELDSIALEDDLMRNSLAHFLLNDDYKINFDSLEEFLYICDLFMEFIELEEIFSLLVHFDHQKLKTILKDNLLKVDLMLLGEFPCGFDIIIKLINKFLGPKGLVLFLNHFERLENALALYTRPETLTIIENAIRLGLKNTDHHFKTISSKVFKNGGLYFINLNGSEGFSYKLNKYITLRLEGNRTNIYVNNQLFNQCKFLFMNIPTKNIRKYDAIDSIDEAAEKLDRSMEGRGANKFEISPATEFWGHCSNLQAWIENNYDTRILHRNLAFPLLKRLTEIGDPIAKIVFKEEIINRLESGYPTVVSFLCARRFIDYLNDDELRNFCEDRKSNFIENLIRNGIHNRTGGTTYIHSLIIKLQRITEKHFIDQLINILSNADVNYYRGFAKLINPRYLNKNVLRALIYHPDCILRNYYVRCKENDYFVRSSLSLNLSNKNLHDIREIKGLHRLKDLRALDLRDNKISDISGLGNLVNLKRLKISGNPIPKELIDKLGGIDRLGKAKYPQKFVQYCQKKDIIESEFVIVQGKKYEIINGGLLLRDLNLTAVSEIEGIRELKELEVLDLSHNQISNLNGLESIKSLKVLNLEDNQITNITNLKKLKNLETLRLRENKIIDVKCLKSLEGLKIIDIEPKRKIADKFYLSYLLHYMSVKEIKQYCSKVGIVGHTKMIRDQIVNYITKSLNDEYIRDFIYMIEDKIISKGISNAIRKIQSNRRENLRFIKLINNPKNAIEIITNGYRINYRTSFCINEQSIQDPPHKCNCKTYKHQGLCDHFWIGFIFSLKMGYFKLDDWTLTPLPDDFEEKIKEIEFFKKESKVYRVKN